MSSTPISIQEERAFQALGLMDHIEIRERFFTLKRRERIRQRAVGFLICCPICGMFAGLVDIDQNAIPFDVLAIAVIAFCATCVVIRD